MIGRISIRKIVLGPSGSGEGMRIYEYIYMCIYIYIYTCTYLYMYVCMSPAILAQELDALPHFACDDHFDRVDPHGDRPLVFADEVHHQLSLPFACIVTASCTCLFLFFNHQTFKVAIRRSYAVLVIGVTIATVIYI